jgi:hypothetical protein
MKPKGTQKTGGRLAGTPNKITNDLRMKINTIVEKNIDEIESDLAALDPKDRLQIIEKLLAYCLPKLQSTEMQFTDDLKDEKNYDADLSALTNDELRTLQAIQNKIRYTPKLTVIKWGNQEIEV